MKNKPILDVAPIYEYQNLAKICLSKLNQDDNCETYFIDKNNNIVAEFTNSRHSNCIEQLTQKSKNLYLIREHHNNDYSQFVKYIIVKMLTNKKYQILHTYDDIEIGVEDGCLAVQKENKWGFINEKAQEIITPQYDDYYSFNNGLAAVKKAGKWGFINKKNKTVIPFEYDIQNYSNFSKGKSPATTYAPVSRNGKWGFVNKKNEVIIPFKYDNAIPCFSYYKCGNFFPVKKDDKWGFIDEKENILIPFEFDNIELIDEYHYIGYQVMKIINGVELYGLLDIQIPYSDISCQYLSIDINKHSIRLQKQNGKYILSNLYGTIISPEFDNIGSYCNEGLYIAKNDNKYGYINECGDIVIPFKYLKCDDFYGGLAIVRDKNYTEKIINKRGVCIFKNPDNNRLFNLGNGTILVEMENYEHKFLKLPTSIPVKNLTDELENVGLYETNPYETAEESELWYLTSFSQSQTGLVMKINLRCIPNKGEAPFIRFQNDRASHHTYNWVKMYLDGTLDNYENKTIIFSPEEMQALKNWININKEIITKHYYQEYDSYEIKNFIKN